MPTNDLDTLIAHLKAPGTILTDVDAKVLASSLEDLKNRVSHVEHSALRTLANSRIHDDHLKQIDDNVGGITRDRDEFRKQVKVATDLPLAHDKKIEELEARVRSVEGAVGAAPFKPGIDPFGHLKVSGLAPAIEPKPHPAYDAPPPKNPPGGGPMPTNNKDQADPSGFKSLNPRPPIGGTAPATPFDM